MSARFPSTLEWLLFVGVALLLFGGMAVHECSDHGDARPECVLCDQLGFEPPADVVALGVGDVLVLPLAVVPEEPPRRDGSGRTSSRGPPADVR